jgi:hypothetical protein
MADERSESREVTWRQLLPWTELFRAFQVALDLNKLLLAAAGIAVMALGWWVLALIFSIGEDKVPPDWPGAFQANNAQDWAEFRKKRQHWNLMNEAVGLKPDAQFEVKDVAETLDEYNRFADVQGSADPRQKFLQLVSDLEKNKTITPEEARRYQAKAPQYARVGQVKPSGLLYVGPWFEDRGPNPYLLVTGQAGLPWEPGYFWEWFTRDQAPVMIEPLVKFLRPILYFLSPNNSFTSASYFLCVSLFTLITWSVFGGAITRIAAVQLARGEKIGAFEALRFTLKRFLSYAIAPLFVLGFCFVLTVVMAVLYLIGMIPVVGDFISGIIYPVYFGLGLLMAIALVGLVGWPLMAATISTEGTDSWEAVSRSYSYVYQRPWHFIWYSLLSIVYGGVCIFFIGFMASFSVYLAKWGMSKAPFSQAAEREPNFLFVYAPTSFGWRELLLEGTTVRIPEGDPRLEKYRERFNGADVVQPRSARPIAAAGSGTTSRWNRIDQENYDVYLRTLAWWNKGGAILTAVWLYVIFLLMLGFGYSFFWTSSTIIYLLLRKSVDAAEMDEVYLEEDDYEPSFQPGPAATPAPATATTTTPARSLPVVEPRPAPAPAPAPMGPASTATSIPAPAPLPAMEPPKLEPPATEPPKPPEGGNPPV